MQAEKRYADAQIRESVIKTLLKTKGYKETAAAWSEDEKEKKRGLSSLLRSGKYTAMRPYAFMEMLDGGKTLTEKQEGILNKYISADVASYRNLFARSRMIKIRHLKPS